MERSINKLSSSSSYWKNTIAIAQCILYRRLLFSYTRYRHPDNTSVTRRYVTSIMSLPLSGRIRRHDAYNMTGKKYHSLKVNSTDNIQRKQYRLKSTKKKNVSLCKEFSQLPWSMYIIDISYYDVYPRHINFS